MDTQKLAERQADPVDEFLKKWRKIQKINRRVAQRKRGKRRKK